VQGHALTTLITELAIFKRYLQLVNCGSVEVFKEIVEASGSFSYVFFSLLNVSSFQPDINFSSLTKL